MLQEKFSCILCWYYTNVYMCKGETGYNFCALARNSVFLSSRSRVSTWNLQKMVLLFLSDEILDSHCRDRILHIWKVPSALGRHDIVCLFWENVLTPFLDLGYPEQSRLSTLMTNSTRHKFFQLSLKKTTNVLWPV